MKPRQSQITNTLEWTSAITFSIALFAVLIFAQPYLVDFAGLLLEQVREAERLAADPAVFS